MKKTALKDMEKRQSVRLEKTLPVKFDLPGISQRPSRSAFGKASSFTPGVSQEQTPDSPAKPWPGRTFEALSRNISEGGVFIETDLVQDESLALNKETILNLEIELLGHARRIKPKAKILWLSKKSRAPRKIRSGFGVKFIQIKAQEQRAISLFISREILTQANVVKKDIPVILREQRLSDRQRRNLQILDIIRKNRLISRAEISKISGINIVTVSNYIDAYLRRGLVFERGLDVSSGGRRPELVEINPEYGYVLGLDLGPLNADFAPMQVVATDFTAQIKALEKTKREGDNIEESLEALKDLIAEVCADDALQREKIRGIGVGVYGIMDKFGGTVRNPSTGETVANYVTIKKELEEEFGLPVFIEGSANCALFAEKWTGVSPEAKAAGNIIYIFSQSQCAIMLKGELYTGLSKSAGQLNFALPRNNSFTSDACWMNPSFNCILRSQVESSQINSMAQEQVLAEATKLGAKVAYLVNVFNPQVVIIGGVFSRLGDIFLDTLRSTVTRWAFRESANAVRIIAATLGEEAIACGSASLVIESAFANI